MFVKMFIMKKLFYYSIYYISLLSAAVATDTGDVDVLYEV